MRLLFEMDKKDHNGCSRSYIRDSARSIIIAEGKVAMVHSLKSNYYKFPGGGIEQGEDPGEAMVRETREEAGLLVIESSIKEYGYVHRVQKSNLDSTERFIQDNYYYLCRCESSAVSQQLDAYESLEGFTLEFIAPQIAIRANRASQVCDFDRVMLEREARVLELLIEEGYFG